MSDLVVQSWDYDKSVVWMHPRIANFTKQWKEIEPELRRAREVLTDKNYYGNQYDGVGQMSHTWAEYCEDIGITKRHANRLLARATVAEGTGNPENYTPKDIIIAVREVMGSITLDPASCEYAQQIVQAEMYYTEENDGLIQPWYGNVFLNPPYQMPLIRNFTDKLISELPNINNAILLTNNNTDTHWFKNCAYKAQVLCFTLGRINFYKQDKEKTYPTNGQTFFYFGKEEEKFVETFRKYGMLVKVIG